MAQGPKPGLQKRRDEYVAARQAEKDDAENGLIGSPGHAPFVKQREQALRNLIRQQESSEGKSVDADADNADFVTVLHTLKELYKTRKAKGK